MLKHTGKLCLPVSSFRGCRGPKITRSVTANRSRVSILGRPLSFRRIYSFITRQNSTVVSHAVCAHVRGPKYFRELGAPPTWDGARLTPGKWEHATPHMYYHIKFRCSIGQTVWRRQGSPKMGGGVALWPRPL